MELTKHLNEPGKPEKRSSHKVFFQPKLSINQPEDVYEQ